ncbi:MAG: FtsW/RodA/SpoVE family cell cycle protein [Verrucomicrobiota bacterium]
MVSESTTTRHSEWEGAPSDRRFDWWTPAAMLLLAIAGVCFIHSAQAYTGGALWRMQIVWIILGIGVYAFVSLVNYKILLEKAHWIYAGSIVLLLLVETPLGVEIYGSRRWIDLGLLNLQPSELAKIAVIVMIASVLARSRVGGFKDSLNVLLKVAAVAAIPMGLIFLQPDLGSTLVFPPLVFGLLYVSNLSDRFFYVSFGIFALLLAIVAFDSYRYYQHTYGADPDVAAVAERPDYEDLSLLPLHDYQRDRILSFVVPDLVDPRGIGDSWNVKQSKISIGSGGVFGKGLGEGTQALLGYLPPAVAHNDFIFAVLAEEIGFTGSAVALVLYAVIILNGFRIAGLSRDRFGMLLAVGVSVLLLVHVFINVGMTMGLTPVTGLPLPFMTYGGSFLLSCCVLQGLIQSVYRFRKDFS